MKRKKMLWILLTLLVLMLAASCAAAPVTTAATTAATSVPATDATTTVAAETSVMAEPAVKEIILATTTSTQDSGLLDYLIPMFEAQTGYVIKTIAVGTGQALELGAKGEADVLLTHAPSSEKPLVDAGQVVNYQLVMHNDFIIVGPAADPAKIKEIPAVTDAFKAIAEQMAIFISRGDQSGTHTKELSIWKAAGIEAPGGTWYQESGQGMGSTLTIANEKEAYTLSDRATYLAQKANLDLDILNQGSKELLNIYHVMQVNPETYPMVNATGAEAFVAFMIDPATQALISEFGVDKYGEPLFFPDALN
ncbi:MAG: tungsten ABC transporter substrate-binding protein [Clostridia bacterium]|nr:tungsten ABC transporter substrate-binding protein [Clostridia bacterium]NCC76381.1 tungsten ABC transporter substrate-binding protein [Clostridia bacterium]